MADVPSMISFQSLADAGMPSNLKSGVRQWFNRTLAQDGNTYESKIALAKLHVKAAGEAVRGGGEAILTGGALGAIHAKLPGGLDYHKVPIDGATAAIGLLGSVLGAQEEFGKDLGNVGQAAASVYAFRKVNDLLVAMAAKASGVTPGGGAQAVPGTISKFGSDDQPMGARGAFGADPSPRRGWGTGFLTQGASQMGEDPIARAARSL